MPAHKRTLSSCQSCRLLRSKPQKVATEVPGFLVRCLLLLLVCLARKRVYLDLKCLMVFNVHLHFPPTVKPLSRKAAYFKTINHFRRIQFSFTPVKALST